MFDFLGFAPPIVGSFVGVLAGFAVNWKYQKIKQDQRRVS